MRKRYFDFKSPSVWVIGISIPIIVFMLFRPDRMNSTSLRRQTAMETGGQIVAVVISADFCVATRQPEVRRTIRVILDSLKNLSISRSEHLITVGISVDPYAEVGTRFLEKLFQFDEIIAGNNWMGLGAIRFLWQDYPGTAMIPQVVILHRNLIVNNAVGILALKIEDERLIPRYTGSDEIMEFDVTVIDNLLPPP